MEIQDLRTDAKYLREKDVIKGELENDEVVKLFTGMGNSITMKKTKEKSKLQEMIDEVNKVYEKGLMMKSHMLLKKLARWLLGCLRAIGGFVEGSWKHRKRIVMSMAAIKQQLLCSLMLLANLEHDYIRF
ncbi:putative UPF0481 protein [Tanacetum coccineum]